MKNFFTGIFLKYRTTAAIIVILICGFAFLCRDEAKEQKPQKASETATTQDIYVQLSGAVLTPGVYKVPKDARLVDVVEMAGGFLSEAYTDNLNMASVLSDGQHIKIFTAKEWEALSQDNEESGLVNINTADVKLLMSLPGIGEQKAKAIIEYRSTYGNFQTIEDIMKVGGIKEAVFIKIKNLISV